MEAPRTRFENEKYIIEYFPSEQIVEFLIKDQELEKSDIVEMHHEVLKMTKTRSYATLFMAMDFFSISAEARNEGSKRHYSAFVIAQAFVVKNMAQRLFANFIMKIQTPVRETRLFSTYEEARDWLEKRVDREKGRNAERLSA